MNSRTVEWLDAACIIAGYACIGLFYTYLHQLMVLFAAGEFFVASLIFTARLAKDVKQPEFDFIGRVFGEE